MNANELAAQLDCYPMFNFKPHAEMLRQQQAEIEALKAKTLTDEEIKEVIKKFDEDDKSHYFSEGMGFFEIKEFAEAILRKAQEK